MFLNAALISVCAVVGLASGIAGDVPPSHLPALLISGRNVNGTSMILRMDGYPETWMHYYKQGHPVLFSSITGNDPTLTAFRALATHHQNGVILWSNPLQKDIEWMPNFLWGSVAISDVHLAASSNVNGMAADWLSHNLYWVDTINQAIVLSSIAVPHLAQGQSPYHRLILDSSAGLKEPWGVAVDPLKGKLYWTDAILRTVNVANLGGKQRRVLHKGSAGERPTSLCLDVERQMLYWIDENHMAIISMRTDGSEVTHLHDYIEDGSVYLRGLDIYEDYLFTTGTSRDVQGSLIYVLNRNDVHDNLRLHMRSSWLGIEEFYDVAILAPQTQVPGGVTPVCEGVQHCPHICVGYQEDGHASCLCADGYTIQADMGCTWDTHFNTRPAYGPTTTPRSAVANPTTTTTTTRSAVANGAGMQTAQPPMAGSSTKGGVNNNTVIAVAVSVVGLVVICAIIALLACFVLRHRRKMARQNSQQMTTPVVFQNQDINNPTYGSPVGVDPMPPPYMAAMAAPPPDHPYENLAFAAEEEKKEKI